MRLPFTRVPSSRRSLRSKGTQGSGDLSVISAMETDVADSPAFDSITTSSQPIPAPSVTAARHLPRRRGAIWMLVAVLLIVVALMFGAHRIILDRAQSDDAAAAWAVHYQEVVAGLNSILTGADE